jgi:excisionase family DNA binding protein
VSGVLSGMTTQLTIQDAMKHFNVSERTIRRWIKQGKVDAEKIGGRYFIDVDLKDSMADDRTPDKAALIGQLQAENAHLRDQLTEKDNQLIRRDEQTDHLQQLLAVSQKSIQQLAEQNHLLLEDTRRRTWWKRIFRR